MIIYLRINEDNKQIISEDELSTDLSHSDRLVLREDRLHEYKHTQRCINTALNSEELQSQGIKSTAPNSTFSKDRSEKSLGTYWGISCCLKCRKLHEGALLFTGMRA